MRSPLIALVLSAVAAVAASQSAAADPLQLAPIKGVMLLRNGQVLSGTIARTGDYYYVSMPRGEIRLKASEVDKVASRLEDLYEEKRGRVEPGKLQDRLDLAEWCVEQKLVEQAAKELAEAASLEPTHSRIALIERRLQLAQRSETEAVVAPHPVEAGPSNEELDRLVRGLPAHAVETFTSTIQPLLVNNCTKLGCHGPRSEAKLRLLRLSLAGPVNRRLTQRNLHAVWQVINANEPAASPLLTQPLRPHGKSKGPIFSGREATQYHQLVAWVYDATRQRKPHEPAAEESPEPPAPTVTARERPKNKKKAIASKPLAEDNVASIDQVDELVDKQSHGKEDSETVPRHSTTARGDDFVPVDPFDPEIFNRRYLPAR